VLCVDKFAPCSSNCDSLIKVSLVTETCTQRLESNIQAPFWNPAHKHVSTNIVYLTFMSEIIVVSNTFHLHTGLWCFDLCHDVSSKADYIASDDMMIGQ
jgi:hypothetical protein